MKCIGIIPYLKGQEERFGPATAAMGGVPLYSRSVDCALACGICNRVVIMSDEDALLSDAATRYPGHVKILPVTSGDIERLRTRGDLFEYVFRMYPDADAAGLFLPRYPFRSAGRIVRDIAPHLYHGRLLSTRGYDARSISTFDIWVEDVSKWTPLCSYQEQFVHPLNDVYAFAARGYHYGGFPEMYLSRNEGVLSVYCQGVEDYSVAAAEDAEHMPFEEASESPLRSSKLNGYVVAAPREFSAGHVLAALGEVSDRAALPWLILAGDHFDLTGLAFYDMVTARDFLHPDMYPLLCDPQKASGAGGVRLGLQSSRLRVFAPEHARTQSRISAHERREDDPLRIPHSRSISEKDLRAVLTEVMAQESTGGRI